MVNIKRQIVPHSVAKKVTYGGTNTMKHIVIHETSNESVGAGAQTHANLQSRGFSASWNYQVDEHGAIQSFEDTVQTWHAGSPSYNKSSIGIEMCVNSDGNYSKTVDNTIELVKHLMKKHNISASDVIPHRQTSTWNKECPRYLLRGRYITWETFKHRIQGKAGNVSTSKPTPSKKPSKPQSTPSGSSIIDYLNSKNQDSSYKNRKRLAVRHGVKNYSGKASQNLSLLNKLKGGSSSKKSTGGKKTIRAIQTKLNNYKVNNISVDGISGRATKSALIKAYQYELNRQFNAGLSVDGISGRRTDSAAVSISYNTSYGNLAHLVQAMLYLQGEDLTVDGYWQNGSISAMKSFQRKNGLSADSLMGKKTSRKLTRL